MSKAGSIGGRGGGGSAAAWSERAVVPVFTTCCRLVGAGGSARVHYNKNRMVNGS
jgi:hypothetical protein